MGERPNLGVPFGADGPWLAAILNVLHDVHDLLDARLPAEEGPVRVSEPAPGASTSVPVSEPGRDEPPARAEPAAEPAPDPVPDDDEDEGLPDPPPRAGRGSGLEAWQAFADAAGVGYPEGARRDDIVEACVEAGVIPPD